MKIKLSLNTNVQFNENPQNIFVLADQTFHMLQLLSMRFILYTPTLFIVN